MSIYQNKEEILIEEKLMVYYSSSNEYILNLIITFSSMTSSENIKISEVKSFIANKDDIFFIPIYGEEELSAEWESFLKKYAKNKCNIGKKTYFYLYGIYRSRKSSSRQESIFQNLVKMDWTIFSHFG